MWHSIVKILANCNQTQMGIAGTLFILLPIAMVIIAPFAIYKGVNDAIRFFGTVKSWPIAEGIVTESRTSLSTQTSNLKGGGSTDVYCSTVKFKFEVAGKKYESNKITWGAEFASNDKQLVENEIRDYPVGKKIVVHYNPLDPSDCIVKMRYTYKMATPWIVGVGFIIFGGGFAWAMIFFLIKQLAEKGLWP